MREKIEQAIGYLGSYIEQTKAQGWGTAQDSLQTLDRLLAGKPKDEKSIQGSIESAFDSFISSLREALQAEPVQRYVCGFLFDQERKRVLLIRKKDPEWQRGLLNGVGGKIEPLETPVAAMWREFQEEIGWDVVAWREFAAVSGKGYHVTFFWADGYIDGNLGQATEDVEIVQIDSLASQKTIPNLQWLIPMALDPARPKADCVTP